MKKSLQRTSIVALALGAGVALALAAPLAASAHISIDDNTAAPGSYTLLTFKVPNESDTASTNTVTLTLPSDTPFASVRFVAVPGWSAELVRTTLPDPVTVGETELTEAVTQVIWTADDGIGIGAGELGLFPLSLGPVPSVGSIVLPVDQGYNDGSVVSWSQTGDDAEHPAPVLYVEDAPPADHHGGSGEHSPEVSTGDEHATDSGTSGSDPVARGIGIAGLALAAVAVVLGAVALSRSRRPA